ncbi:hypothetical protein GF420_14820 [candidate division GN15 bacterium]|nr:hypothetical protein [candidate division GN15 bacterium]
MRQVWQIAAGDSGRCYSDLLIKHDVVCMGPGDPGPLEENDGKYRHLVQSNVITSAKLRQLRTFCSGMQPGDIVLLRESHRVVAVGVVAGAEQLNGYSWEECFDDVFGWDLQHTRRVIWQDGLSEELESIQQRGGELFGARKQIPTITAVNDTKVLRPIQHLFDHVHMREPRAIPKETSSPLHLEAIGERLFEKGLPNDSIDQAIAAISRQRRLASWYRQNGREVGRPTEHEVVAHMILPLLLALGWSEQLLAVEWKNLDLAAFSVTPTNERNCVMICEAKGLWHGLQNVLSQATAYASKRNLVNARKIILTDGMRIYLHERIDEDRWCEAPSGYINFARIRERHIAPENTDAIETLVALTPAGIGRSLMSYQVGDSEA